MSGPVLRCGDPKHGPALVRSLGGARTVQVVPLGLRRPAFLMRVIGAMFLRRLRSAVTVAQLGVFLQPSPLRERVSGDEPMTDAQASYLQTLSEQARQPFTLRKDLTGGGVQAH
jgi:Protein of unknown function (DUF3072)